MKKTVLVGITLLFWAPIGVGWVASKCLEWAGLAELAFFARIIAFAAGVAGAWFALGVFVGLCVADKLSDSLTDGGGR